MNIFNNKKSTVGYFVLDNNDGTHKSLYKPVQQSFLKLVNCPAVSTVYKIMYDIFPLVSMNIKFGINDDGTMPVLNSLTKNLTNPTQYFLNLS